MHSLLSLLFSFSLAGLIYGLSLLPTASLGQTEETEELVHRIDRETSTTVAPNAESRLCCQDRQTSVSSTRLDG